MRIISGTHRGRVINLPKSFTHRPTTDMAKESLFNILTNIIDFDEISVLDLFAGSGSISFEFASRGTEEIISVDSNYKYVDFIKKCSVDFALPMIKPIKADVFKFIRTKGISFDLIFADPPYDLNELKDLPTLILDSDILKKQGIFILEHSSSYNFSSHKGFTTNRKYGSVNFSFFKSLNL